MISILIFIRAVILPVCISSSITALHTARTPESAHPWVLVTTNVHGEAPRYHFPFIVVVVTFPLAPAFQYVPWLASSVRYVLPMLARCFLQKKT